MTLFELNLPKQFEKEYKAKLCPGLINRIVNGVGEKNKVKLELMNQKKSEKKNDFCCS